MSDIKLTGELSMDTSQGEASVDKFGKSVNKMARETAEAAKKAADALAGIGDKSEFGTEKITRQERSITASIKRTTTQFELLGKTASQKLEFKINTQGLDAAKFEPALQKLREMEAQAIRAGTAGAASLDKFGMSAKQTANSLRGIPAQFQDIVVSLQGGQAPMTVFLQQGSQLSGMFGGAGNAAKAFGGYVMGLINPFTLAAAGVAGLGFAMASLNGKDAALLALSTQLTGTGRASVAAVGDIKTLVAELNKVSGVSKASATAILGEFAKVSGLGGEMFRGLGASVADFAAATGTDLPTAAKKLASAFADPAKGAKDLEESLGTLTAAQTLTIEKMAAMGDKAGAQVALMEALKTATQGLADQAMTPLGKATEGLSNAWDTMTGAMGKSDTLHAANRILASMIDTAATLAVKLSQLKLPDWLGKQFSGGLNGMVYSAITGGGQQGVTGSWSEGGAGGSFAPTPSESDGQIKAALDATKAYSTQASAMIALKGTAKQAKDALKELESQNKGTGIEATTLRDRISGINEKLAEMAKKAAGPAAKAISTAGQSEVASIRARIVAGEAYLQSLKAEGIAGKELNEGEKLAVKIQKELEGGLKGVALANKQKALTAAESLASVLRESDALKELLKGRQEFEKLRDKEISGQEASILKMEEKAQAMEDEVRMYGMGKEAIEALSIARLQERIDILAGFDNSAEQIALIEKEIDARKRLAVATDSKAGLDAGVKAAKEADAEWKRTATSIENTLTDSLMRAFEGGKGFAQAMKDTIVNMFKTMVLRPIISAVMSPVSAAIGSTLGMSGAANAATGGGSLMGMASNASTIGSAVNWATSGATAGLGGAFASGFASGSAGLTPLVATSATTGTAIGGATAAATSIGSSIAMAVPYIAAAVAAVAVISSLLSKKDDRHGGGYAYNTATGQSDFGGGPDRSYTGSAEISNAVSATAIGINGLLKQLGSTASLSAYYAASETSNKGRGGVLSRGVLSTGATFGDVSTGSNYSGDFYERSSTQSPDAATAAANLALDLKQSIIQALQATTDIPDVIKGMVAGIDIELSDSAAVDNLLSEINAVITGVTSFQQALEVLPFKYLRDMSFDAAAAFIAAGGGIEALSTKLGGFYDNFYSETEKLLNAQTSIAGALSSVGFEYTAADIAAMTREQYRTIYEAHVEAFGADSPISMMLLNMSASFAAITPAAELAVAAIDTISDAMKRLTEDTASLQVELLRAQGNTTGADAAQYAIDTAGLTEAERAVFDYNAAIRGQITALTDAATAWQAISQERAGLQDQLDQLTMSNTELLAKQRNALDASNRALFDQVQAASAAKDAAASWAETMRSFGEQAAAAIAASAKAVADERVDLQNQIDALTLTGDATIDKQRDAVARSNRALFDQLQAATAVSTAQKDLIAVSQDTVTVFGGLSKSLHAFSASVLQTTSGLQAGTASAAANFRSLSARASSGDRDAMGQLAGAGQDYLSAASASASSELEYRKAQLTVASGAEAAALVADRQVSIAEQQLGALNSIKDVLTMAQAQANLGDAQGTLDRLGAAAPFDAQASAVMDRYSSAFNSILLQSFASAGLYSESQSAKEGADLAAIQTQRDEALATINAAKRTALSAYDATLPQQTGTAVQVPRVPAYYSGPAVASNSDVVAELKALREELAVANRAIALNTARTARLHDKWDIDGQPAQRAA